MIRDKDGDFIFCKNLFVCWVKGLVIYLSIEDINIEMIELIR